MNPDPIELERHHFRREIRECAENARRARLHRAAVARCRKAKRGGPR